MVSSLDTLRSHLEALQPLVTAPQPDARRLQGQFLLTQQHFQRQVLPLGEPHPSAQPILTEMNRTLRLLAMDVAFVQTARQSLTTQHRQRQMVDRLAQLLDFCEALRFRLWPGAQGDCTK